MKTMAFVEIREQISADAVDGDLSGWFRSMSLLEFRFGVYKSIGGVDQFIYNTLLQTNYNIRGSLICFYFVYNTP
ncbi:hypothetical protein Hanom_Chr03g00221661 [Helianthus anomalus]